MTTVMSSDEVRDWLERVEESRESWLKCDPGCAECGGFGWDVFDQNPQEDGDPEVGFDHDLACVGPGDDSIPAAAEAGAFFAREARRFVLAVALGSVSPDDARRLARVLVGLDRPVGRPGGGMKVEVKTEDGCYSVFVNGARMVDRESFIVAYGIADELSKPVTELSEIGEVADSIKKYWNDKCEVCGRPREECNRVGDGFCPEEY